MMANNGWKKLLEEFPWFGGEGSFPLPAYSEFMPPIHVGFRPHDGQLYPWHFREDDQDGFYISEAEEFLFLQPGLQNIGMQCMEHVIQLGTGKLPPGLAGRKNRNLMDNPFWPDELSR